MDKRQVMYDMERCICHVPDACRDCSKYKGIDGLRCMEELMTDALALLKEQDSVDHALSVLRAHGWKEDRMYPEIVRCKDCKHWDSRKNECHNINSYMQYRPCFEVWFCADGERREQDV